MVLSTLGVAADVTPSVIETFFSHFLHRKQLRQKPTAHISYHEGLRLIRQFLSYASEHTVEDVQAFTGQWVPCPTWVVMNEVLIPDSCITKAAALIQSQLGPRGIEQVGGKEWWQWRRPEIPFKAEWIEMKADFNERKAAGKQKSERIMLYVHGGAYYFGSTGEHRYQMQRHARKLKAQLLAPKYRLAPQFPFPCGLHDCIATYLHLIQDHHPSTVLLAGDSAGGGMVVSMLVILRDQGIPLPAGAILLSPWVDLTHSFPSVAGDGEFDYIPPNGFHHKPSTVWPPPNAADLHALKSGGSRDVASPTASSTHNGVEQIHNNPTETEVAQGFTAHNQPSDSTQSTVSDSAAPAPDGMTGPPPSSISKARPGQTLSIELDGKVIEIQDQIQMYTANHLLAHPLVSPVMQSSLGGLPPLLIQVGGGELLRDEQIYLAHKAANPTLYLPPDSVLDEFDPERHFLNKYGPTRVQLQVWDDLCHVPHTLSFTRPAKFMYRSVAQFGAWALAHAQSKPVTIMDDDDVSIISTDSSDRSLNTPQESEDSEISRSAPPTQHGSDGAAPAVSAQNTHKRAHTISNPLGEVGRAGDPIPHFVHHMIRQRVDRHGIIYPLPPPADLPALHVDSASIGVIKPGPVRKWIAKKSEWDTRYAKEKRNVQKTRLKEMKQGYDAFDGETPPPTALAGRIQQGMGKEKLRKGKSWGLAMWSGWGSKHDQTTIDRKKKITREPTQSIVLPEAGESVGATENPAYTARSSTSSDRERPVSDNAGEGSSTGVLAHQDSTKVEGSNNTFLTTNNARPHNGVIAYPFKLRNMPASASTATLDSGKDHVRPMGGVHGTYQSSIAGDEHSPEKRLSGPPTPSGLDGTTGDKEIGGHDWIVGREKQELDHSGSHDGVDAGGDAHTSRNGAANGAGINTAADTGSSSRDTVQGEKVPGEGEGEGEESGTEIGGHNWIVNGRRSRKSGKAKGKEPAWSSTTNGVGGEAVGAVDGDNHRGNGGSGGQGGAEKLPERPPAQTFVTARESL